MIGFGLTNGMLFVWAGTVLGLSRLGIVVQSRKQLDVREGQLLHDSSAAVPSSRKGITTKFIKFGLALTHLICELFVYILCLVRLLPGMALFGFVAF